MTNTTRQPVPLEDKLPCKPAAARSNGNAEAEVENYPPFHLQKLKHERFQIKNETLKDDKIARKRLMRVLCCVSIAWLIFTATIIVSMGSEHSCYRLVPSVAIAFITTSLGTVLGLWAIGLRYFFHHKP
jgi:hypothetical protein